MSDAIAVRNLSYRAGKEFAIRDLAMTVPTGSVYGFLGPNGSGKTTTLRLMLGMLPAEHGTISLLGHEVPTGVHKALAKIGYVPERLHLAAYDPWISYAATLVLAIAAMYFVERPARKAILQRRTVPAQ